VIELSLGEYGIPINTMIELAGEQNKNDRHIISKIFWINIITS